MTDPLQVNVALDGVETSIPLLPEGDYQVQVKESSVDSNKDKTGLNWNLKLGLASATTAVDGRAVNPDFPLFAVCALQARDDSKDPEAFKRQISSVVDALFGTDKTNRPNFTAELVQTAVGKLAMAHVIIDEYQGQKNNKVSRLKAVTA